MNEGWDSGGEDDGPAASQPIKSQSFGRGGGGRDRFNGGQPRDFNNQPRDNTAPRGRGRGGGGGVDRGRGGRADSSQNWRENGTNNSAPPSSTVMVVKSGVVGKIIGRGGTKIRELRESTGGNIQVGEPNPDDFGQTTNITIYGTEEAQLKAKKAIEDIENPPPVVYDEVDEGPTIIDWAEVNRVYEAAQKEKLANLPPMLKDFYEEHPDVANMTPEDVTRFRMENNNICCKYIFGDGSEAVPNPVTTFEQCFGLFPDIMTQIHKQGFEKPSPIQAQAWPVLLKGHDLIGIAQTGTGKTLAFLLPAMIHIENQPVARNKRGGANILVMAPTRELAIQIEKEVAKYQYRNIRSVCIYGGGDRREQIAAVSKGVEIIIATPGRLNDLVQAGIVDVTSVTYLVLDEADRMLDLGFEPQIRKTLLDVRPDRQTVMTSATWPEGVRRLAQSYMVNPIQVFVGSLDLAAVHSVTQTIEFIDEESKSERMMEFFDNMCATDKVIVFVGRKVRADDISAELSLAGVNVQSIHGGREQCDREQALDDLKTGDVRILIATDVASRGIDIEDVTHIFNYDFPRNIEEYVHRVGRTGRAGKRGESISLFTRADWSSAAELIPILEEANQEVPEELRNMAVRYAAWQQRRDDEKSGGRGGFGGGGRGGGGGFGGGGRGGGGGFGGGGRGGGGGFGGGGRGGGGGRNKW